MEQYETWLLIAQDDLKAANILLESDVTNAALFHVQQGIEKCLKAYLSFKKQETIKTHDLVFLLRAYPKIIDQKSLRAARGECKPHILRYALPHKVRLRTQDERDLRIEPCGTPKKLFVQQMLKKAFTVFSKVKNDIVMS